MYEHFIKRALDIILCTVALLVFSPIFLITAIAIKLSSVGPVFYHSDRTGKNHEAFHFYKFRSMHVTDRNKGMFVADQERLFFVGRIIRKLKIDELPQLINVLQGKMSIVGPRPMPVSSVDTTYHGKYQKILDVKPGLTSIASLYDYTVGDTYTDDKAYRREVLPIKNEMELLYVEQQSFTYDVWLVARTIVTILQKLVGRKVYGELPELTEVRIRLNQQE